MDERAVSVEALASFAVFAKHLNFIRAAAELRISFTTERGAATPSLGFTLADLTLLVEMGITLSIIA